jgi:hypothetical protein
MLLLEVVELGLDIVQLGLKLPGLRLPLLSALSQLLDQLLLTMKHV